MTKKFFFTSCLRNCTSCVWFFLLNYELFCSNWSYQGQNYQNVTQIVPLWKIVTILFVLFYQSSCHTICPVFIWPNQYGLETFYSFKITCILVRHIISLKKNGGVISKIYYLILWSLICTPLILVSASVKMAGTSATVTYNSMTVDTPGELLI